MSIRHHAIVAVVLTEKMSHSDTRLPTTEEALTRVGSGTGFGSLVVRNGRSQIGHIAHHGHSLCGVEKRVAQHYDTEIENEEEEFRGWIKFNWQTGYVCRACQRALLNAQSQTPRTERNQKQ